MKHLYKITEMKPFILITIIAFLFSNVSLAKKVVSVKSGDWNNPTTWDCKCTPKKSDNVVVAMGHTISLNTPAMVNHVTIMPMGVLDAVNSMHQLRVHGNWTNNGTFRKGEAKVIMGGQQNQIIGGSEITSFYELDINQKSTKEVKLDQQVDIYRKLQLTNGVVKSDNVNLFRLKSGAESSGGAKNSYIEGPVEIETEDVQEIVVGTGKNGKSKKTKIAVETTDPTIFRVEYFDEGFGSQSTAGLDHVCNMEHWLVERVSGAATAKVILAWNGAACGPMQNTQQLRVARYDGMAWVNEGSSNITGNNAKGEIASAELVEFGRFTFGCEHTANFKTAGNTEDNFENKSTAEKSSLYNDEASMLSTGNYSTKSLEVNAYPNPAGQNDAICINVKGETGEEVLVVLTDLIGKEHYSKVCLLDNGNYTLGRDYTQKLSPGVYLIIASSQDKYYKQKIIIE